MGTCKGCNQVFTVFEMKDGFCYPCIDNDMPSKLEETAREEELIKRQEELQRHDEKHVWPILDKLNAVYSTWPIKAGAIRENASGGIMHLRKEAWSGDLEDAGKAVDILLNTLSQTHKVVSISPIISGQIKEMSNKTGAGFSYTSGYTVVLQKMDPSIEFTKEDFEKIQHLAPLV